MYATRKSWEFVLSLCLKSNMMLRMMMMTMVLDMLMVRIKILMLLMLTMLMLMIIIMPICKPSCTLERGATPVMLDS